MKSSFRSLEKLKTTFQNEWDPWNFNEGINFAKRNHQQILTDRRSDFGNIYIFLALRNFLKGRFCNFVGRIAHRPRIFWALFHSTSGPISLCHVSNRSPFPWRIKNGRLSDSNSKLRRIIQNFLFSKSVSHSWVSKNLTIFPAEKGAFGTGKSCM